MAQVGKLSALVGSAWMAASAGDAGKHTDAAARSAAHADRCAEGLVPSCDGWKPAHIRI